MWHTRLLAYHGVRYLLDLCYDNSQQQQQKRQYHVNELPADQRTEQYLLLRYLPSLRAYAEKYPSKMGGKKPLETVTKTETVTESQPDLEALPVNAPVSDRTRMDIGDSAESHILIDIQANKYKYSYSAYLLPEQVGRKVGRLVAR